MDINQRLKEVPGCTARGANMGRPEWQDVGQDETFTIYLQHVAFVDGAYDLGGAYWGAPDNLYCAWGADEEVRHFLRADDYTKAYEEVREMYPNAEIRSGARNVDVILQGYLEAALWSSTGDEGYSLDENYTVDDISEAAKNEAREDIESFLHLAGDVLAQDQGAWSDTQLGFDFWLTRSGHGAGLWDRFSSTSLPGQIGKRLTEVAHTFSSVDPYVADDGMIYFA